ncbi:MAG: four helix bundle protein [Candidatus Margulisbacteria bacterium]|nr:four helix bundle protein [Candidatus Margulisiibacteriota bacterium]
MSKEKNTFSFEDLRVWQESRLLNKKIYQLTQKFPDEERFGLINQLRRASVSISLNIAEGKGRYSKKEFAQFLYYARGSLFEVVSAVQVAEDMGYVTEVSDVYHNLHSIKAMLNALIKSLKSDC